MFLLLFAAVNVAVIRLRKQHPELDRGFRVPWVPVTPIVAILAMLFIAVFMFIDFPLAWVAAGGWMAAGVVFYYAYSRKRETAFTERAAWMERIERKEYRVLVAISRPQTVAALMEPALAIARKHHGEVVAVTVAEVPEGESLMVGRQKVRLLEPVLEEAVAYARERGMEARSVVKIGRRISHVLVQLAREEQCNFLIVGQPHSQSFFERIVSSVVERVLHDAPCQVGVVYGGAKAKKPTGVVVPVTRGDNSRLAAELAPAFAEWHDTESRALTIVEPGRASGAAAKAEAAARETLAAAEFEGELKVLRRKDVAGGLNRAIRRGELVLIGAPQVGPAVPIIGVTVPAALAKRGRNTVIVVRDVEEHRAQRFERVFFSRSK
jgi:nucleotide-binding universal stress UspA family protein